MYPGRFAWPFLPSPVPDVPRKELIERVIEDVFLKESDKEMLILIIHNRYREVEASLKETTNEAE